MRVSEKEIDRECWWRGSYKERNEIERGSSKTAVVGGKEGEKVSLKKRNRERMTTGVEVGGRERSGRL